MTSVCGCEVFKEGSEVSGGVHVGPRAGSSLLCSPGWSFCFHGVVLSVCTLHPWLMVSCWLQVCVYSAHGAHFALVGNNFHSSKWNWIFLNHASLILFQCNNRCLRSGKKTHNQPKQMLASYCKFFCCRYVLVMSMLPPAKSSSGDDFLHGQDHSHYFTCRWYPSAHETKSVRTGVRQGCTALKSSQRKLLS